MQEIENSILSSNYYEILVTTKVRTLCRWVDLITVFRDQELTRGGELIELTILVLLELLKVESLCSKATIFQASRITLSWMLREILDLGKITQPREYSNFDQLVSLLKREVDMAMERFSWSS